MKAILPSFILLCALAAAAQEPSPSVSSVQPPVPPVQQTIVVLGAPEPLTLGESPRSVVLIPTDQHPPAYETVEQYLRADPSAFIEQRGAGGAQADISIRGSSFEQTLVLLNGLRINDAQTSHHNLDLPVPVEALRDIEVLHGSGSTLYGSDAIGGVVDFLTAVPTANSLTLRAGGGSFGENEETALASLAGRNWSESLTGARNFSTGFMADRDYRNETASTETRFHSAAGLTDILLAGSDRAFGADQFYGDFNSWERTKSWFASARQEIGARTEAAFGYRRHADNFILFRNDPAFYANNHIDQSWQAVLRRTNPIGKSASLYYGLEFDGDAIHSNNLGTHARNQGAGYLDLDLHPGGRWTLAAGLREEILSGGARSVWSPDLAGSLRVAPTVKLRASAGYGFRLPTYTDLYYSDPATIGNAHLKPESAWSTDGGVDWYANARTTASVTVFYSRQHDAIDYVRPSSADPWQAQNLSGLRFTGVESSLLWQATRSQTVRLAWTALSGAQRALHGLQSEYVFNYPVNNASFEWLGTFHQSWVLGTRVQVAQRYQQTAYPVWDFQASRQRGRIQPWLRIANLSNTGYEEVVGVPMPGRSFTAGLQFRIGPAEARRP
jgi:outer membrane cobalamin receptor